MIKISWIKNSNESCYPTDCRYIQTILGRLQGHFISWSKQLSSNIFFSLPDCLQGCMKSYGPDWKMCYYSTLFSSDWILSTMMNIYFFKNHMYGVAQILSIHIFFDRVHNRYFFLVSTHITSNMTSNNILYYSLWDYTI